MIRAAHALGVGTIVLAGVSCTGSNTSAPAPDGASTTASDIGGDGSKSPTIEGQGICPELEAWVPDGLDRRKSELGPATQQARTRRVTFNQRDLKREVTLSTAATGELFGHGLPGEQTKVRVQDWPATRVQVSDDTLVHIWKVPSTYSRCRHWSVTTVGLSPAEVRHVLETVRLPSDG